MLPVPVTDIDTGLLIGFICPKCADEVVQNIDKRKIKASRIKMGQIEHVVFLEKCWKLPRHIK